MANENDQQHQQNHQKEIKGNAEMEKALSDQFRNDKNENCNHLDATKDKSENNLDLPTACKGKINDLVADLCLNGHRSGGYKSQSPQNIAAYSDYTSIRSTIRPVGINESIVPTLSSLDGSDQSPENEVNYVCNTMVSTHNVHQQQSHTQNSSFSFKHFLSSSSVPTAPSTTVTSLDPPVNSTSTTSTSLNTSTSSRSLQTSTGARPKVPQSNSVSSTSISSLTVGGVSDAQSLATKMKRSPRFSSFDSQASLAEYVGSSAQSNLPPADASAATSDFRLYPNENERDRFKEWNLPSNAPTITVGTNSANYNSNNTYVPRSYSNYDMSIPQTSPRRRVGIGAVTKENRPTRLPLNTNQNPTMAAKMKLNLPLIPNSIGCGERAAGGSNNNACGSGSNNAINNRKTSQISRQTDFQTSNPLPGGAAAAALPDFVQDHWMDSWYANDMHLNSPPSSPIHTFMEDITGAHADCVAGEAGVIHTNNSINRSLHVDNAPTLGSADRGDFNIGHTEGPSSSVGSKMLPDFLSDGPIIHSSQRLADVAAGLPSNSIGSPEESSLNNQLSRLRLDNERLQRELNETRLALNEQTLRVNNLERQLIYQQKQHQTETGESLESNKNTTMTAQIHMSKLKQQVQQLTAEVEILRREKELMREEGAVGGSSLKSCDRSYASAAISSTSATAAAARTTISDVGGMGTVTGSGGTALGIRPSRQQQLSRDLRRAASNAELNLKQLLAGVENLRQMATNIEKSETNIDYNASPDLFSDFLDECDDYGEYPGGGPAL